MRMRPHQIAAVATLVSILSAPLALSAQAKDAHCQSAQKLVEAMTAKLPIEVDAVTNTVKAEASCANKQVLLSRSVELKQSRMQADFKEFLQKQDNKFVCENKKRRALTKAGWHWIVSYKFQDGDPVKITAKCAK